MRVELDETMFRLVAPDESASELVPYGGAAFVEYDGSRYYCFIDDPNSEPHVMRIDGETEIEAEVEETEFELDADGEEDEGEEAEVEEVEN